MKGLGAGVGAILGIALSACHAAPKPAVSPTPPFELSVFQLQHDIDAILAEPALEQGYWGIVVRSLRADKILYARNPHKLMMPASTLKILTLAAAAETLGWNYVYETRLLRAGAVDRGVLNGDLLVVGSGDPGIVERDGMASRLFDAWADQLRAAGIGEIAGRVIGDDNAFDDESLGFGWSWDDLTEGFAAGVSALQYNENRVQVTITPGAAAGAPAVVSVAPGGSGLVVDNRLTTSGNSNALEPRRLPGSSCLELVGSVGLGSEPAVLSVSVDNPTQFFVTALRDRLIARGIDVRGPAVDIDDIRDAPSPASAVNLATYRSPPLATFMALPFKFSLNLHEETLLKTVGAAATGRSTFAAGLAATRSIAQGWGVPPLELIQVDGSGLSRYNYLTADALVIILTHIERNDTLRDPFEAALPVAGRDGTLANRMNGTAAEGNARVKTGSMSNVRAQAGYVTTADGEPLAFAILANNFGGAPENVNRAMDAIVVRLAGLRR